MFSLSKIRSISGLMIFIFLLSVYLNPAYGENQAKRIKIGIDEKLGSYIPLELSFVNEKGESVKLSQLINKPTVLALVYYHCPGICSPLLLGLADVVNHVDLEPGKDFNIVIISFDPRETPKAAIKWKEEHMHALKRSIPEASWTFMTGDSVNIRKLTDAAGYYYQSDRDSNYAHMTSLILLSPKGKITRYIFGTQFLPADLEMAILDAKKEKQMPTINKLLAFCYSYDRQGDKYIFNFTKVIGTAMLFLVTVFFAVLVLKGRKKKA